MDETAEPGRRARKRTRMLDLLTGTAARLFEQQGYEAVTMEQIAAEADVAKRTLYNHFPTKEALLARWLDAELEKDLAHLADSIARRRSFASRAACILDASAAWCSAHPEHLMAYLRYRFTSLGNEAEQADIGDGGIVALWQRLIAAAQESGELGSRFPPAQLATWFHHLYLAALLRWLTVPGLSLQREFADAARLFVDGAAAR